MYLRQTIMEAWVVVTRWKLSTNIEIRNIALVVWAETIYCDYRASRGSPS